MIRYLKHSEIDFEKWDACMDDAINGIFYGYSWYLDMCARTWDALVEDDYRAVMPLPVRLKGGIRYLFQPFFVQQLGVFSRHGLNAEVTRRFLDAIPASIRYLDYNLNTYNVLPADHPLVDGRLVTYELDLIPSYAHLYAKYSDNTRRNLKKAEKNALFLTPHGRPEDIIHAFRQNRGRWGVPFREEDYRVLKHLIYAGMHKQMVSLKCAYTADNNFCAGIVFYKSHKKAVWLFSGATPEARQNGAMAMLVDDFIREHAGKEMVLDFEGSSDPNLARFYRGFGSEECVFLRIRKNRLPILLKPAINAYFYLRKATRRSMP